MPQPKPFPKESRTAVGTKWPSMQQPQPFPYPRPGGGTKWPSMPQPKPFPNSQRPGGGTKWPSMPQPQPFPNYPRPGGGFDYASDPSSKQARAFCFNSNDCQRMGLFHDKCCCVKNSVTGRCGGQCVSWQLTLGAEYYCHP